MKVTILAFSVYQLINLAHSLKVMELMAPYRIQNVGDGRFLTASQRGILGLKTGAVTTQPYFNRKEQQWQLIWDPSLDDNHDGYRLESRMDFLNQVTSFYPDGSTIAMPNIWEVVELKSGTKMFRNKRTRRCLQVLKSKPDVVERTCSVQNRFQKWSLDLLDLDKRVGDNKRRFLVKHYIPVEIPEEEERIELDNSHDITSDEEED